MRIWKRLLGLALCLCLCAELLPVTAQAAAALPVTFSTNGIEYKYANTKNDVTDLTYGTNTATGTPNSRTSAALTSDGGITVSLETDYNTNYKLCYREVPVTVDVPANTTYSVTFECNYDLTLKRGNRKATATCQARIDDLGIAGAADSGTTVKFHWEEYNIATIVNDQEVTSGNRTYINPGGNENEGKEITVTRSKILTYDFVNNTNARKAITHYFGFWVVCQRASSYANQGKIIWTITPKSIACTVNFDPNGGEVSKASMAVTYGKAYGALPTPTRTGYSFSGWYTAKTGGTKIVSSTMVGSSAGSTLYAHWKANQYTVTFDSNGGMVSTTSKTVTYGETYASPRVLPEPTYPGHTFDGWYTTKTGGTRVTEDTVVTVTEDHTLYARWHLTPAKEPTGIHLTTNQTILYGKKPWFSEGCATDTGHTISWAWYECSADGSNGKQLPERPKMPTAGVHYYYAVAIATRKDNSQTASARSEVAKVTVNKATPMISTKPTASMLDLAKSTALSGSRLTGGIAQNRNLTPYLTVPGTFAWKDGSTTITKTGKQVFSVVFTPEDTNNYNSTEIEVSVQVQCAHNYKVTGETPATCTKAGVKTYTCTACNDKKTETLAALEHSYGEPTYAWNGINCTAERVCSRDSSHKETETVTAAVTVTQHQSCILDELSTYTASFKNAAFAAQTQENVVTANKLGHAYAADFTEDKLPTCTEAGSESRHCSRCGAKTDETVIPATGHTNGPVTTENNVAATCTTDGSYDEVVRCTVCKAVIKRETKTIPATGHKPVTDAAVAPTCTQTGLTEGKHCSVCNTVLIPQTTVEKLPHSWDDGVDTKAPTCTETGVKTFTCTRCNNTKTEPIPALGHDWGEWVVTTHPTEETEGSETRTCQRDSNHTETQTIPKLNHTHTMVHHPAVDADCGTGTAGNIEYWVCSGCNKVFSDEGGANAIELENTVIHPAHDLDTAAWSFNESNHWHECKKCGQQFDSEAHKYDDDSDTDCNICGYSRTITPPHIHDLKLIPAVPATCVSAGNIEHYRCTVCGKLFGDSSGTRELTAADVTIDKLPHTPETIPAVPATCEQSGMTEGSKCSVCQEVITAQTTIPALGHDWQAATCETPKTCTHCHVTQGKALGHDWGRYIVTMAATQESEGVETRTCQRDNSHTQTRPIPKLPASTYGVSGEVKENDGTPAKGVTVTLVLGDRQIASKTTDSEGKYSFGNVAPGVYNLVAKKADIIMTIKVEVISKDVAVSTIIMPQGKTNSVVEVKSEKPEETVEAVIGNLETVFKTTGDDKPFTDEDQAVVNGGGSVEIKLTVTKTDTDETSEKIEQALPADTKVGVRLVLEVSKTVTETTGSSETTTVQQIKNTGVLLETIIRLPAELQGKDSYTVYRLHEAAVHTLTAQPNADGEYIEVSPDKTAITIHAKLYSEYVIAYQERGETGGNGGNDNGGGRDDNDDSYTPPSVPAPSETNIGYRVCRRDDACPIWPFADAAPTAWYHDGVHYCIEAGLMHGISADKFLPDGSVTRAQLAAILWRLEGNPAPVSAAGFSDVADGAWYAEAVRWAADSGVVKGYADGRFRPNDAVTREQMAALLYRFAGYKGYDVSIGGDTDILRFTDGAAVGGYAVPAMRWACGSGMVHGIARDGGMLLAPRDTTTRAQAATLIMRFQSAFAKEP